MTTSHNEFSIDYIELPTCDLKADQSFYEDLFGWTFESYGPNYASFKDGRLQGGLNASRPVSPGGPLVVVYSSDLEETRGRIGEIGGQIVEEIFSFPGGRRFHFRDPSGNELAVWSDR